MSLRGPTLGPCTALPAPAGTCTNAHPTDTNLRRAWLTLGLGVVVSWMQEVGIAMDRQQAEAAEQRKSAIVAMRATKNMGLSGVALDIKATLDTSEE